MYRRKAIDASRAALAVPVAALAVLLPAPALGAGGASSKASEASFGPRALRVSRELWATIDVCNPADQPDTVGIRGSMPGDRHSHDKMYMSFRLQSMNASNQGVDLPGRASSSFVAVGSGAAARQGGTSFELKPVAGKPAVTLRG